jgi:RNA polymerase sigma-70 factor (ECF subfamily)
VTYSPSATLLATIERCRRRLWALCYRMTGSRAEADDLSQEAIARAIEREGGLADRSRLEGWLFRIATTVCLDHLRRGRRVRRVTELVDPLDLPDLPAGGPAAPDPEAATILRDDVRFAIVVALQSLSPRQRAVVLLHDVCDRPLPEVAEALDTNVNALKAALHRARAALARSRLRTDADRVADPVVVERLARAIESRSVEALTALLAEDVWGVVDGGGVVRVASKPSFGRRAVARRWANAGRRVLAGIQIAARVRRLNGEPAVVITLPALGHAPFATVHVETRGGLVAAIRVVRDPRKLAGLAELVFH